MSAISMEATMAMMRNRMLVPVLLASVLVAATGWPAASVAAEQAAVTGTVVERALEPVVFGGQASITGRVIQDTDFGAPPVLELIVDLGGVTATGARSGRAYQVQKEAIVRRPLQPFEQVEIGISFALESDVTQARSALASFGVRYSGSGGLKTTPVKVEPHPPS